LGAYRSCHKGRRISGPQSEGPQRKWRTEHVRIVAFRPSVSDEHGVDRPKTFGIAVEFVEPFDNRLLVGKRDVQAPDPQSVRALEEGIQGVPLDVESTRDSRQVGRGEGN